MEVQNFSFNRTPEETERMLRQLGHKIQNIADRVKRIGSYALYLELSEIAANVDRICTDSLVTDEDEIEISELQRTLPFSPETQAELNNHVQ